MASNGSSVSIPIHTKGETVPFFIDGKHVVAPETFDVYNPATGEAVHKCCSATADDARAAVDAAASALPAWKVMLPTRRREIFLRAADIIMSRREELIKTHMDELGVPRAWADFNLAVARDLLLDAGGRLVTLEGSVPTTQDPNTGALVLKEPFGVVLAVAPW